MKFNLFILSVLLVTWKCSSQVQEFTKYNTDTSLVHLINKQVLITNIKESKIDLNWVIIYTNHCAGTEFILENVKKIKSKYNNKINIFLCSSEPYKSIQEMLKVLKGANVELSNFYIIDSEKYNDDISDSREKGLKFRNDICKKCRKEIIGVPYSIFFNIDGEAIKFGYPSKLDVIEFIDGFFMKK